MLLLYGLLIFMILGAVIAIETRDLLSSVISLGAMGFGLSIVFLVLAAPDLAMVQVVVEVIALILMLRLVINREDVTVAHRYRYGEVFATSIGLVFFGIFIVFSAIAFRELTPFGYPLMRVSERYVTEGLTLTSAANVVTAILFDFRGYDTLGEATVIFTSITGAIVVLRRKGRKDHAGDDSDS